MSVVGHGNLGRVLAIALKNIGHQVREIVTRDSAGSMRRAQTLAKKLGARASTIESADFHADVIWICVPDAAIAEVARSLTRRNDVDWRGKTVFHLSGALAADELKALKKRGASVGSAHPMNSFVASTKPDFSQIPFAIEGDAFAVKLGSQIARSLGGEPFTIRSRDKVLYHSLGAFASPLLISHLQMAEQIGRKAGIKDAKKVFAKILQHTVNNYLATDAAQAFSGPLLRGDVSTIQKHLAALLAVPAARAVYVALARNAIVNLPVKNRPALKRLLK